VKLTVSTNCKLGCASSSLQTHITATVTLQTNGIDRKWHDA
jgi:hypothetical protein